MFNILNMYEQYLKAFLGIIIIFIKIIYKRALFLIYVNRCKIVFTKIYYILKK